MLATKIVFDFPPMESCRILVSLLSRNGMWYRLEEVLFIAETVFV